MGSKCGGSREIANKMPDRDPCSTDKASGGINSRRQWLRSL